MGCHEKKEVQMSVQMQFETKLSVRARRIVSGIATCAPVSTEQSPFRPMADLGRARDRKRKEKVETSNIQFLGEKHPMISFKRATK